MRDTPSTITAKAEALAVVADNASLNVNVIVEPSELVEADTNVGGDESFVTVVDALETALGPVLPALSVAPLAANTGCTVPSPQLETVSV